MAESLKRKTTKGLFWSGMERLSGQIVSFGLALILARLVSPADYGTLAIVMIFISVAGVMVDAGFANALIRKVDCTDVDRSTVLYFNIIVSIFIYGILYVISPFISEFYNDDDLIMLIRSASVIVVIGSLSIVQQATLISRIDFKKQTAISLVSSVVSGVFGIYLAYHGFGIWALVAQTIILYSVRCIMLWCIVGWKPLFVFSRESFNDLFGYSYKLMLSNLIIQGGQQTIQLVLGKFYSVADLGCYNYANKISSFIPSNAYGTIQRVLFPVFSQIQNDEDRLELNFRRSLILSMSLIVPSTFCISALAEPIIQILLTEEWYPTTPLLRVICITMAIWPLLSFNMNLLFVKKRSDLSLRLEVVNLVLRLTIVFALYKFGILWVCIALCIAEALNFFMYSYVVGTVNSYGLIRQTRDMSIIFLKSTVSYLVVYYFILEYIDSIILKCVIGSFVFLIVYLFQLYVFKGCDFKVIKEIVQCSLIPKLASIKLS